MDDVPAPDPRLLGTIAWKLAFELLLRERGERRSVALSEEAGPGTGRTDVVDHAATCSEVER